MGGIFNDIRTIPVYFSIVHSTKIVVLLIVLLFYYISYICLLLTSRSQQRIVAM